MPGNSSVTLAQNGCLRWCASENYLAHHDGGPVKQRRCRRLVSPAVTLLTFEFT